MDEPWAVLYRWGEVERIRDLDGGHRNRAVLIRCSGELAVAKTTNRTEHSLRWVEEVQQFAAEAGFIVPRFLRTENGSILSDGVVVESFVVGRPLELAEWEELRVLLSEFHQKSRDCPQRPEFQACVDLISMPRGGDVDLEQVPAGIVELCRRAWEALRHEPRSAIHGDLSPSNVLRHESGAFALLDWDEARVDASILDIIGTLDGGVAWRERMGGTRADLAAHALDAWEIAACWIREREYAIRKASSLVEHAKQRDGRSTIKEC